MLELTAGMHRFGVTSDDGFQLRSGATPEDPNAMVLAQKTSSTYDGTFDVTEDGQHISGTLTFNVANGATH